MLEVRNKVTMKDIMGETLSNKVNKESKQEKRKERKNGISK